MRSLKSLHRGLFQEAFAKWEELTQQDIETMSQEELNDALNDITRRILNFTKTYGEKRPFALRKAWKEYKQSSKFKGLGLIVQDRLSDLFYYALGSKDWYSVKESFYDDARVINAAQEALEFIENVLNEIDENEGPESSVQKAVQFFQGLSDQEIEILKRSLSHNGIDDWPVNTNLKSLSDLTAKLSKTSKDQETIENMLRDTVEIYEKIVKPKVAALETGTLPEAEMWKVLDIIKILQFYGKNPDVAFPLNDFSYAIPYRETDSGKKDEILDIPRTDPAVGKDSQQKVKDFVLNRYVMSYVIDAREIKEILRKVENISKCKEILDNEGFMSFVNDARELIKKTKNLGRQRPNMIEWVRKKAYGSASREGFFFKLMYDTYTNEESLNFENLKKLNRTAQDALLNWWMLFEEADKKEIEKQRVEAQRAVQDAYEKSQEQQAELRKKYPPEAPEKADFRPLDDYAFALNRPEKAPEEDDNDQERELYNDIRAHFNSNKAFSVEDAQLIQQIMKKGYYKDVFHEPTVEWVYRGMGVSDEWLRKFLNLKEGEELPKKASRKGDFKFTPFEGRGSHSWSQSVEKALEFAADGGDHMIVLVASVKDNKYKFVSGPAGLYDVKGLDEYEREEEAIGLDQIKVAKVYWKQKYDYSLPQYTATQVRPPANDKDVTKKEEEQ